MYTLIIIIGMQAGVGPSVGVTSHIVGKFRNLEECKEAASQPHAGGTISDLGLHATWGVNWYCTYTNVN
jgi:hypothetical protein